MSHGFLPISKEDMKEAGIEQLDFVYICGDAYVDHPSFGHAIISRILEAHGYKVGIIAQPDWKDRESINRLGEPRLGFLVSAGNMDSMVNHYSVSKKRRTTDAFTPGGVMGKRPDYATIVYCNLIRQTYKHKPIIIGGIEASLRRLAHYDYWSNKLKRSILLDSGADLISYGMGEHSIVEIADALDSGLDIKDITFIDGTVYKTRDRESIYDAIELPHFEALKADKLEYAKSFYIQYSNTDPFSGKRLFETYDEKLFVVQNPPAKPLTQSEMDSVYALPYMRDYHPSYKELGGVPAIEEVKFSLISNRGCYGGCSFCALTFHQGRIIQTRSHESILAEANKIIWDPDFKGYIHDVGGPTANFRAPACDKQMTKGACPHKQCLFPKPCQNLKVDHSDYLKLLRKLRELPNVKKVFIRSGIRFDYLIYDNDRTFLRELCEHSLAGKNIRYHLVVGRFNPNREKLEQYASEQNNVVLHCDVKDMAGLMTACQLAVTAGGTTIYELSVLGVPFVCFSYAENQEGLTEWLGEQKKAGYAGKWHHAPEETRKAIGSWCRNVCENRELRQRTYEAERTLIDGQGAARIAEILQTAGIEE